MTNSICDFPSHNETSGMQLTFSPAAKQVVKNMQDRCHQLTAWYGEDHEATRKAERSLAMSLAQLIGLGGRITAEDGENGLSLYGQNEFISYGLIWHSEQFPTEAMRGDGMPMPNAPQPGTWSTHS